MNNEELKNEVRGLVEFTGKPTETNKKMLEYAIESIAGYVDDYATMLLEGIEEEYDLSTPDGVCEALNHIARGAKFINDVSEDNPMEFVLERLENKYGEDAAESFYDGFEMEWGGCYGKGEFDTISAQDYGFLEDGDYDFTPYVWNLEGYQLIVAREAMGWVVEEYAKNCKNDTIPLAAE